jgi:hypothetical protein
MMVRRKDTKGNKMNMIGRSALLGGSVVLALVGCTTAKPDMSTTSGSSMASGTTRASPSGHSGKNTGTTGALIAPAMNATTPATQTTPSAPPTPPASGY